jgi:hypothetical protein
VNGCMCGCEQVGVWVGGGQSKVSCRLAKEDGVGWPRQRDDAPLTLLGHQSLHSG